ncbi:MAG: IS3 family transposase [Planctomycetes bacterium]|nr:IS3 family transposase [Planctomycetota bacterium]
MKFALMGENTKEFRIASMCRALAIRGIYDDNRFVYGAPRIHKALQKAGETCSRNRVARIMRPLKLRSKATRRYRVKTTDSKHDHPIAPDLLKRDFTASAPNRVWVSDITYIGTDEAGCTWPSSWTCSPGRSSVGR